MQTAKQPNTNTCEPQLEKTLLTIGQDLFSIQDYLETQYNASLHEYIAAGRQHIKEESSNSHPPPTEASILPSTFMFYTDIQSLRGLTEPVDYGSGIEYADGLVQLFRGRTAVQLQIGLWLNGTAGCQSILAGELDDNIDQLFEYLLTSTSISFLRVGYEFDNPDFGYDTQPRIYREAFRYMVQRYRQYHSTATATKPQKQKQQLQPRHNNSRIQFVWHSWAAGTRLYPLLEYYPGDSYVDWCGVSLFSQFYPHATTTGEHNSPSTVQEVLDFCHTHDNKPIMIAESTPFGGIPRTNDPWAEWFVPVLRLVREHRIAMWSYIDCDWDAQPMWRGVGFGDTRLATNRTVLELWRRHVLKNTTQFVGGMEEGVWECRGGGVVPRFSRQRPTVRLYGSIAASTAVPPFTWSLALGTMVGLWTLVLLVLYRRRGVATRQSYEQVP